MLTMGKIKFESLKPSPESFLGAMEIFKKVPAEALREIEKKMVEKKFAKHQTILLTGDPAESVWFVKEGFVKSGVTATNGRCQTLCRVGAKDMFGTCCCFNGGEIPCQSVAETDVTVVSLPMADFLSLLGKYPGVSVALIGHISRRLRQSKDMQAFDQENVGKRILHVLVSLSEQFGTTIPLTRKEIAEIAGTTVETAIRTFSKFSEAGLVLTARGKIVVKNVAALVARMEEL